MNVKRIISVAGSCVVLLAAVVVAQTQQADPQKKPDAPAQGPSTIKVDVDLVMVNATVTDPFNRLVTGLEKEHFQIWEDKFEQDLEYFSAEEVPVSLGIIFDVSGSMKEKLSTARDAAVTFLKTGNPEDEYFLVEFANKPTISQDFTTDISRLQNHIIFTPAKGMTAMYDAVYLGLEKLKEGSNPKKSLLLITDGEDNRSRYTFSNVKEFVKEQDVQIYAIGVVDSSNSQLGVGRTGRTMIEELADLTGGRSFFPDSVYELEDICTKIGYELKNQYMVGYKSTNPSKDGKWRKIRMKINPPKGLPHLNIRYKQGYYAPLADGQTRQ